MIPRSVLDKWREEAERQLHSVHDKPYPAECGAMADQVLQLIDEIKPPTVAEIEHGMSPIREALAACAHEAWVQWMRYQFTRTSFDGRISAADEARWRRQAGLPYAGLPETEKESDRAEADKMLKVLADFGWILPDKESE